MIRNILLFWLLVCMLTTMQAQDKYEKEYRIKEKDVPELSLQFMNAINFTKKIKWYREEGLEYSSIEAKTKYLGHKYSIEFNLKGEIEDVEKEIKWEQIPLEASEKICDYLSSEYQKTKLQKLQVQYTGDREKLIQFINTQKMESGIATKYEMILKTKKEGKYEMVEYLFSENGTLEKRSKIIFKNTDNLEY